MSDPDHLEDEVLTLGGMPPLLQARAYWTKAVDDESLVDATMAQTAAMISIADSLQRLARDVAGNRRRLTVAASALDTLAKEIAKIRYAARR